jgi:hypothetical protein
MEKFKIISHKPCTKKYLFHASSNSLKELDPKFCRKVNGVYEYDKPTIHAFDYVTNEYCFQPVGGYKKVLDSGISWAHHKLKLKDRVIFLGTKLKGYIYVLDGSQFYEVVRKDFECGKWKKSTEWIFYKKIKPIKKIKILGPIDVENIKEYEYLGSENVGLMSPKRYLKLVKNEKVAKAINKKIKEKFKPWNSAELRKFLK